MIYPLVHDLAADGLSRRGDLPGAERLPLGLLRVAGAAGRRLERRRRGTDGTIAEVHASSRATYGAPRVHAELRLGLGIACGRKRIARLMKAAGLVGVCHRRKRSGSEPLPAPHEDLVQRRFTAEEPNRLWVSDITEHPTAEAKVYCAAVVDVFSRMVVGWSIADHIRAELVVDALEMACWRRRPQPGTIVHADRGSAGWIQSVVATPRAGGARMGGRVKRSAMATPEGGRRQRAADRALRPAMRSPGRPQPSRAVQRAFWRLIADGWSTEKASAGVGVSWPVGFRWFRHAGGMVADQSG